MQILDGDKPLLVPYRPRGEVPIFIRRHGPNIQPIPIVDGQVHTDAALQQFDGLKLTSKAPQKEAALPVAKKSVNDAVRARSGKYWK
jgi:hypothetical protein